MPSCFYTVIDLRLSSSIPFNNFREITGKVLAGWNFGSSNPSTPFFQTGLILLQK